MRQKLFITIRGIAICWCMITSTALYADQNDPRLEELFASLKTETDMFEANSIANAIWQIWFEHEDSMANSLMTRGVQQMESYSISAALQTFDRLIALKPDFAEAWNRRATIYYQMGEYDASLRDIDEVLKLEPFHFGALSGRGLVYMGKQDYFMARGAFLTLLEVYPAMPGVKENILMLEEVLRNGAI